VNLPCTIYWESSYPSAPSPVIKSCHDDADGESKDYDLLVPNWSAAFDTTERHAPNFLIAVLVDAESAVEDSLAKASDLALPSQPPVSTCFLAPNASYKFPDTPSLVTSASASEVCMSACASCSLCFAHGYPF